MGLDKVKMKKNSPEHIQQLLEASGLVLRPEALDKLWEYHKFLRKSNEEMNLTRIHNFENIIRKHYIDSLFVAKLLQQKEIAFPQQLLDIGSGAGFPGIPLAIHLPHIAFILAEDHTLRADFLQELVKRLALTNVSVHKGKISQSNCPQVGGAITRALENIPRTLLRVETGIAKQGLVIFMKGPGCDHEIEAVAQQALPYKLILDHPYYLPHSQDQRRLVILQYCQQRSHERNTQTNGHGSAKVFISSSMKETRPKHQPTLAIPAIHSRLNPRFKLFYSLRRSHYVKKHRQTLICGRKLVLEFLDNFPALCQSLILPQGEDVREYQQQYENAQAKENILATRAHLPPIFFGNGLFTELDFMNTGSPLLLVKTPSLEPWTQVEPSLKRQQQENKQTLSLTLLLPLSDPENIGAALRCCAAFPPCAIVLLKESCNPYHPKAVRASAGYCFHLPLYQGPSIHELAELYHQSENTPLANTLLHKDSFFALDMNGTKLSNTTVLPKPMTLLVGMEGLGIPKELPGHRLSIPLTNKINSLNASVSLGIALYILSQKLQA